MQKSDRRSRFTARFSHITGLTRPTRFIFAVGIAVVAVLARVSLDPVWGSKLPYITLFPAIMLSAWLGGFWPGLMTTGLSAVAAYFLWILPAASSESPIWHDLLGLLVFVLVGTAMSLLNEAWRRSAAEVGNLMTELSAANDIKMQFLARMSHELRTPLNAIDGYSELLAMGIRGPVTAEQTKDLERIRQSSRFLLTLINDILDFARLEAGQTVLRATRFGLRAMLVDIESLVGPLAAAKGINYRQLPFEDLTVRADEDRVRQVIVNIVSNAIKFTDVNGSVMVACETEDGFAWISIVDTGCGIPRDKLATIFDPFVQLHSAAFRTANTGVGLGLSICRDLVRQMGGELQVDSAVGKGSTFRFSLPRDPVP